MSEIIKTEEFILDNDYAEIISSETIFETPAVETKIETKPIVKDNTHIEKPQIDVKDHISVVNTTSDDKKYKNLRLFNGVMGILHLGQAIAMLMLSKAYSVTITTNYLAPNLVLKRGVPKLDKVFDVQLGPVVASFLLLSALAHFILIMPGVYQWYINNLKKKINVARWYEYALSSSVMIVVIALLCGMFDLGSLILLFALNACMNLFGLVMERHNSDILQLENKLKGVDDGSSLPVKKVRWVSFIAGCFAGIIPWIVLSMYFFAALNRTNDVFKVPDFVYFIFYSLFIFFNIFAINMVLQYKQFGAWKNYTFGEKIYILLSLVAKSALAWQVFGGTLRNN